MVIVQVDDAGLTIYCLAWSTYNVTVKSDNKYRYYNLHEIDMRYVFLESLRRNHFKKLLFIGTFSPYEATLTYLTVFAFNKLAINEIKHLT